jgi:hypothetical protein
MNEIWKSIREYPNYKVSNFGRIKNESGRFLKPKSKKGGYRQVSLCKSGIVKDFQVHRLVAIAFIPNPMNLSDVNHKDENPANNRVENLEWCTHKYNLNYGTCQTRRRMHRDYSGVSVQVAQYSTSGELIKAYKSQSQAAKEFGVDPSMISMACNGKQKFCCGYIFKKISGGTNE